MTMTATSTNAKAPAGLYTVPVGSNETLRKGVAKLQFKVTSPVMKTAAAFVLNKLSGGWDSKIVPAIHAALRAKGVTNVRMPSGNFWADSNANLKPGGLFTNATKPKGYHYYLRKGYDPVTGIAFVWVVVS